MNDRSHRQRRFGGWRRLVPLAAAPAVAAATLALTGASVPVPPDTLGTSDLLFESFANPPSRLRPFVRWWWNGARVDEREALRQLDVMKAAGIGGVEINTIAMPDYVPAQGLGAFPEKPWLGPEWCAVVKAAAEGARERGMTADIIVGSGWPFGGRFLPVSEQTKRVRLVRREVRGPSFFQASVAELARGEKKEREEVPVAPRVLFVRLGRADAEGTAHAATFEPGDELGAGAVRAGRIRVRVPVGAHVLRLGLLETGFTHVKLGAPGADGPVVDHWNAAAVRHYLDHMSSVLGPALGGRMGERLGGPLRASFVDSLELDRANWTDDLPAEFARRRGYDLAPYLPFVLDPAAAKGEDARADTVRRVRYDFHRTLVELFRERFLETYVAWAHDNGLLARIQAYGRETHPLEGSLVPDLPEGESWLWSGHDRIVVSPTVVDKYVSSGAHLAGRGPVSFEAMTNAVPVFREMPEDFKLGMDASLLAGVLHPVMHGFNYSPRQAGFPGWVRFGSWLNEQNPWWPHFHRFADYAARLTTVLSQSEFQARVALLGPRADEWARDGLLYQPFPEVSRPWYHYHLWQALQSAGYGSDYVSEAILRSARVEAGALRYGTRAYDTLLLMDVESLEPETAAAIARFAGAGGHVVFMGRAPERSPGLKDAAAGDRGVREAVAKALAGGALVLPAPDAAGPLAGDSTRAPLPDHARRSLLAWVGDLHARTAIEPDVRIDGAHPDVGLVHHRAGDRDVFFFANTSREQAVDVTARLPTGDRRPWLWDPETGRRAPLPFEGRPDALPLHFEPLQSMLILYEPAATNGTAESSAPQAGRDAPSRPLPLRRGRDERPIVASWDVELRPAVGAPVRRAFAQLFDLSLAVDPAVNGFGGVAVYRAAFEWKDPSLSLLSLGAVHGVSAVRLNGRDLGVRWYGPHFYDTAGALVAGRNSLEIEVTTSLGNFMRARKDDPAAKRWAWWFPPVPAGLVGPVQLMKPVE